MSLWKSLFGLGRANADPAAAKAVKSIEYKGYLIEAAPYREGGQYQVAGIVSKTVDGVHQEHRFVRADRYGAIDDAAEIALMKGRQIVDQQGDRMFTPRT